MTANPIQLNHTLTILHPLVPAATEAFEPAVEGVASPPPLTSAVLFNATTEAVNSISVGAVVSPPAGLPGFSSSQAPSSCTCRLSQGETSLQVTFANGVAWSSTLLVGSYGGTVSIWCFENGFVLTTASNQLAQISFWSE